MDGSRRTCRSGPESVSTADTRLVAGKALVRRLVNDQFPQWSELPIRRVAPGGWDNDTFRLGDQLLMRLPTAAAYAGQVAKEQLWLPRLAPLLPVSIPTPVAQGRPAESFPWSWSIYRWIEGTPVGVDRRIGLRDLALDLANFLTALHRIDPAGGPPAGAQNFHRGGSLATYDRETRQAFARLVGHINCERATELWDIALASQWNRPPLWVHGDVSSGNLLLKQGKLSAVIDFGQLGVGDPACDLAIAWTLFRGESRNIFRSNLGLDVDSWNRGRGWALWKASIVAAGLTKANGIEGWRAWKTLDALLRS